jgi:thiol-disulfide isomerase/thioredoxin
MKMFSRVLFFFFALSASFASAQGIAGRWDGTAKVSETLTVPVHLDISGSGNHVEGAFLNGPQRSVSTEGSISGNSITLKFAQFDLAFQATLQDGALKGTYSKNDGGFSYALELKPHVTTEDKVIQAPIIQGVWIIPTESAKGEHAFRLIVNQYASNAYATILRVDGDTGVLAGTLKGGTYILSHFGDVRASILEITPAEDGTLALTLYGTHTHAGQDGQPVKLTAYRPADAKVKNIPEPDDFSTHTSVRNPQQPFQFSFPDLDGKLVSNTDAQFKNKVVLVNVTGSWCPNCHDEAPYLAQLYRKYRTRGVEIVALDFEEPEQIQSLTRLRSFIKKYGIEYTYLVAGVQKDVHDKVPQAVNLNAWPTTFFVGKDGLVHAVETGFTSSGSGKFDSEVRAKYVANIERLLAENAHTAVN